MAIIGIDLGTTNSLGCVYRDGKAELIPNRQGSYLTPSVVSVLEDGTVLVGQPAKDRRITDPERTFFSFKKDMGTDRKYRVGDREFTPEELSAFVVSSIVEDAKRYLGEEIEEAVISVPAYFHDRQRVATRRAGLLAGVKVERILNEPSAAALANYQEGEEIVHYLVFDFGGGTLDVSIVDCLGTIIEIKAVSGDNHLGGDDFDELIVQGFLRENRLRKEDLSVQEYSALVKKAEQCKIALSTKDEETLHLVVGDRVCESTYNMKRLMDEGIGLLTRIRGVIGRALRDCRILSKDIDWIILVGGSSKMPLIQSYVRHLFHRRPLVQSNCDEMVALGLGMFCGIKERKSQIADYVLTDICPFSLGTEVYNKEEPSRPLMSIIIERNSALPCSRMREYRTVHDMQKTVRYDILQGEHLYADENIKLGSMEVPVTPMEKEKEKIQVRFGYDLNGILMVDIHVDSTGLNYSKVISEKLSEQEAKKRAQELKNLVADPSAVPENQKLIEKLESLYEEVSPAQKEIVSAMLGFFKSALNSQSPTRIQYARKAIRGQLPQLQVWNPFAEPEAMDLFSGGEDDWEDPFAEELPEGWEDVDTHPGGYLS